MEGCDIYSISTLAFVLIVPVFGSIECEVCFGSTCGETPDSYTTVTCPSSTQYCMNVIENLQTGEKKISKRCAAWFECDTTWIQKAECINFQPNRKYLFSFTCSYCCTTARCNSQLYPTLFTLYTGIVIKPTPTPAAVTGKLYTVPCHVCDSENCFMAETTNNCLNPDDHCMTHLAIDSTGTIRTTKRCVKETECRQKWIESTSPSEKCAHVMAHLYEGISCEFCCTAHDCSLPHTKQ